MGLVFVVAALAALTADLTTTAALPIDPEAVVKAVNALRSRHGSPPVQWSATLAAVASDWADALAASDRLAHSPSNPYGENLAQTYSGSSIDSALALWYAEGADYDFSAAAPGFNVLHFTQLVWASTSRIGAGVSIAVSGRTYVVMEFDPPGNYQGRYTSNVFPVLTTAAPPVPRPPPPPTAAAPPVPRLPSSFLIRRPPPYPPVYSAAKNPLSTLFEPASKQCRQTVFCWSVSVFSFLAWMIVVE